jgi:octaprenyl-diphosphate synthase
MSDNEPTRDPNAGAEFRGESRGESRSKSRSESRAHSGESDSALNRRVGDLFERMRESLELVERAMRDQLSSVSELLPLLGEHVISSGGKRLRPMLVMLSAELCGYTGPRRVQLGAALELIHTATLLHDDVVDLADIRRGQSSANAVWGNRRAVLAGDFFYARSSSMIVEDGSLEILEIFSRAIRLMSEGELLQMQNSFDAGISQSHYYKVIERKSAILLSAACEIGSVLGGVTRAEVRQVAEFGRQLGVAFQVRDDVLDYQADADALGKPLCADLREGKVTLPLLLTLKRCTPGENERIGSALKTASLLASENAIARAEEDNPVLQEEFDPTPVLELIERYRGVEDSMRRAEEHAQSSADAIAAFPDGDAKRALLDLAKYAIYRDH